MHLPPIVTDFLGHLAYAFNDAQPLLPTYGHLLISALFPIFTGSYASLSRPSSAAKQEKKTKPGQEIDGEDEEDEQPIKMEGLSPSDAIMFPLLAGVTLTGLYFLIKWLQDPALLNKILNWYFAGFSIFSVSRMVSDGLDVFHSVLFPHDYGDGGILYHVDPKRRRAVPKGVVTNTSTSTHERSSPLPGIFSRLPLPHRLNSLFWTLHILPTRKLTFTISSSLTGNLKLSLGIHGIEGLLIGLSTVLYYNFVSKPWYLTNLMGFGFSYGALQLMSPTTFTTGTMLLLALLCYDFYMVFKTPMMVTVAKSLDIPIKLLFPRPSDEVGKQALSMLGLGDVVLPGIMIGLALRFDLYLFYLGMQRKVEKNDKTTDDNDDSAITSTAGAPSPPTSSTTVTIQKAPYLPPSSAWGDRFWTTPLLPSFLTLTRPSPAPIAYTPRNKFPTPYFTAGMIGYIVGMLSTLTAMQISSHPQPALIYLVPGVLVALWGTALVRGEVREMWVFSDAFEEEEGKVKEDGKGKDGKGKVGGKGKGGKGKVKSKGEGDEAKIGELETANEDAAPRDQHSKEKDTEKITTSKTPTRTKTKTAPDGKEKNKSRTLFTFSIVAPPPYWTETSSDEGKEEDKTMHDVKEVPTSKAKEGEHVEKKRKIA